jgi:hypothetical protein
LGGIGPIPYGGRARGLLRVYRDLADIPDAPRVSPPEANQEAIQSLMMDRANTAQTAEDLRRQPFNMPAPSMPPGF